MKHRIKKLEEDIKSEVDLVFKRIEEMYEDYLSEHSINFLYKTLLSAIEKGKEEGILHDEVKNRVLVRYEFKGFSFSLYGAIEDLFLKELAVLLHDSFAQEKGVDLEIEPFLFNGRLNVWVAFDSQDTTLTLDLFKSKKQILALAKEIREKAIALQETNDINDPKNKFKKRTEEILLPNLDLLIESLLVCLTEHIRTHDIFSLGVKRIEDQGKRVVIEKILDIGCLRDLEGSEIWGDAKANEDLVEALKGVNRDIWNLTQEEKKQEVLVYKKQINVVEETFYNIISNKLNQVFKENKSSFFVKENWIGFEETREL